MSAKPLVFIALSGGVDSAVAALRLIDQGFRVVGIHMETWKDPKWLDITSIASAVLAKSAADSIGVPFVSLDVRDVFFQRVIRTFVNSYLAGMTPNPCLFCNPQIKWGILQTYALEQGGDYFATGHYARLTTGEDGLVRLLRGVDTTKDQSYVLSMLSQFQLRYSLLPLGGMTKTEVRRQAQALKLLVADHEDSQDLCFLGGGDYRDFLQRYAPESTAPGEIVDMNGKVLGRHQGLAFYTIGQRRGIQIAASKPYYVVDKDIYNNRLMVGFAEQATKSQLQATQPNYITGEIPQAGEIFDVMIRYRAQPVKGELLLASQEEFRLKFKQELRGMTPGQVAVLYQGEVCLGGGIIQTAW